MEQPNNRQLSTESAPEKLPIRYYFDRCPQEVTLNILQYADIPTLNSFSQTNCNDAPLVAHEDSLWVHRAEEFIPYLEQAIQPFVIQWQNLGVTKNFLVTEEDRNKQVFFLNSAHEIQYLYDGAVRPLMLEIINVAVKIFHAIFLVIKKSAPNKKLFFKIEEILKKMLPAIFDLNKNLPVLKAEDLLLFVAVHENDAPFISKLLSCGANPLAPFYNTRLYPWMWAVTLKAYDAIEMFIEKADSFQLNEMLKYMVIEAPSSYENIEVIKKLITAGADVNYYDKDKTPLLLKFLDKPGYHLEILEMLLLAGAGIEKQKSLVRDAAFLHAIRVGDVKAAHLILEYGANVDCVIDGYKHLLYVAIRKIIGVLVFVSKKQITQTGKIAQMLVRKGANFNVAWFSLPQTYAGFPYGFGLSVNPEDVLLIQGTFRQKLNEIYKDKIGCLNEDSKECLGLLIQYINSVGKKVQQIIKDSKIKEIFNDNNSDSELTVQQKLMAVLQYYAHPGELFVGSLSFAVSRFSFYNYPHTAEVQALLKDLASFGEQASAQQCHDALQATLETCQKKPGYDCDGTLALLGELLLAQLKREIGKEALAAREAVRKQKQPVTLVAEEMGEQSITPTMGN